MSDSANHGVHARKRDFDASTEQPADVLASWIAHVLHRELPQGRDKLLLLCGRIETQVAAWPRGAVLAAVEDAAAAVAGVDVKALKKTSWLDRLSGRDNARREQFGMTAAAALRSLAQLHALASQAASAHPAHLSSMRRGILELRMEEGEVRQRLAQVRSWHAQMWQQLLQRRGSGSESSAERIDRLMRLANEWTTQIEFATEHADHVLLVAEAAEALINARTAVLQTYRRELCAHEPEWSARITRLTSSKGTAVDFAQILRSADEANMRVELSLHELLTATAEHEAREQAIAETLRQLRRSPSTSSAANALLGPYSS